MSYDDIDNRERQEAEFEFITAAYSPEEAWIITTAEAAEAEAVEAAAAAADDDDDDDHDGMAPTTNTKGKSHISLSSPSPSPLPSRIHRRLELPIITRNENDDSSGGCCIQVELILTFPQKYPTDEESILLINASLMNTKSTTNSSNSNSNSRRSSVTNTSQTQYRKLAMDSLPNLLETCRITAQENAGFESVFIVLSKADEWIDNEWKNLVQMSIASSNGGSISKTNTNTTTTIPTTKSVMISRKLIYSHHIIAKSKRKAISDLGKDYNVGGYYKIGWPGIIIIEGEENSCNDFIDEIRSMRWQHLVVRGETEKQSITFDINSKSSVQNQKQYHINNHRKFFSTKKVTMIELGEDQMSTLSKICNDVGLKDLFMTSMKIYNNNNINDDDDDDGDDDNDDDNDDDDDKEDNNNNNNRNVAVDRKKHHVEENTTNE